MDWIWVWVYYIEKLFVNLYGYLLPHPRREFYLFTYDLIKVTRKKEITNLNVDNLYLIMKVNQKRFEIDYKPGELDEFFYYNFYCLLDLYYGKLLRDYDKSNPEHVLLIENFSADINRIKPIIRSVIFSAESNRIDEYYKKFKDISIFIN